MALHVARDAAAELLYEYRSLRTRADDTHVAQQHIHELRELVEGHPSQPGAQPGFAFVLRMRPHRAGLDLGVVHHGPELDTREHFAVFADPLLDVEHWAAGVDLHQQRDDRQDRR